MNLLADTPISAKPNRFAWLASLLATIAATVIAAIAISVASSQNSVALLWFPTALFACLLLTQSPAHWPVISLLAYASVWCARLFTNTTSFGLLDWLLPLASVLGALIIAGTARRFVCQPMGLDPALDRDWFFRLDLPAFFRLLVLSILPGVIVPAMVGTLILSHLVGAPILATFESWLAGDGLGAVSLLPLAFCLVAVPFRTTLKTLLTIKTVFFLVLILVAVVAYPHSTFILFYTTGILAAAAAVSGITTTAAMTFVVALIVGYGIEFDLFIDNPQMNPDRLLSTYLPLILSLLPSLFIAISRQEVDNRLMRTRSMLDQSEQIRAVMTNEMPLFCYVRNLGTDNAAYLTPALKQYVFGDPNTPGPYSPEDLFHQEDLPGLLQTTQQGEDQTVPFSNEIRIRRYDGKYIWHKIISYPVLGDAQQVIQRVGVMQDVDDLHQVQSQLRAQTAELTRSNQSLELFAVAASHDLQEPLRMVSGYTQLLKKRYASELNEDARSMIDIAADASVRMSHLIQELLAFSRVASPDQVDRAEFAMAVKNSSRLLAQMIRDSHANIEVAPDLPAVNLTQSALNQLMLNLIGNSIRYRAEQSPAIGVRLLSATDDTVTVGVQDNGLGIDPEHHESAFEVFKRFNHERAAEKPGSGIGLSLCKRIVEAGGGQISIDSDGKSGTTFKITLRRAAEAPETPATDPLSGGKTAARPEDSKAHG